MVATVFVSKIDAMMKTYIKRPLNTFAEMSKNFLLKLLVVTNVCWQANWHGTTVVYNLIYFPEYSMDYVEASIRIVFH